MSRSVWAEALLVAAGGAVGVWLIRGMGKFKRSGLPVPRGLRSRASRSSATAPCPVSSGDESPALVALRRSVDAVYPSRSRAGDGMLPSQAHHDKNASSDHERGDALDITLDFTNGPDLDKLAELLIADDRVTYVIWNKRIANRTPSTTGESRWASGEWRTYPTTWMVEHGSQNSDPHTGHLHVSVDHSKRDEDRSWKVPMGTPVPSGYVSVASVSPEMATWAKELLRDGSFRMGQVRTRDFDGRAVAARAEAHPASASIGHPHRGVSLYESSSNRIA